MNWSKIRCHHHYKLIFLCLNVKFKSLEKLPTIIVISLFKGDCVCKGTGPECVCKTISFNNSTFTFSGAACQCSEFYCYDTSTGMVRGGGRK